MWLEMADSIAAFARQHARERLEAAARVCEEESTSGPVIDEYLVQAAQRIRSLIEEDSNG